MDNYALSLASYKKLRAYEKATEKQFHSYHYQLAISARQEPCSKKRDHHKTATNYLNWIKRQQFFCLLFITLAVESNTRGLFIIVYGHSTSDSDATHVFTQKRREEVDEEKKLNKHHVQCWWLYTEASNRGKLQTEPFSRNEFLNKRRAHPGGKQLLLWSVRMVNFYLESDVGMKLRL